MKPPRVIIAGWYTVDPEKRDAFVQSFKDLVRRARDASGCLDFAMTADPLEPSRINTFELWRSEEDLQAWRKVAKGPKAVTRLLRIEVQKHVVKSSGPPLP